MSRVACKRGRNEHLTQVEIAEMRQDLRDGMSVEGAADKYRCSDRIVQKYWAMFGLPRQTRRASTAHHHNSHYVERVVPPAKVYATAGITKAMLMGGRAPRARCTDGAG